MSAEAEALRALRADLRSADPAVRDAAFARVAEVLGTSVREIVAEALSSDNPEVREAAEGLLVRLAELTGEAGADPAPGRDAPGADIVPDTGT